MDISAEVASVEKRAAAIGVAMKDVLAEAGVHRATWDRWKAGSNLPHWKTWHAVLDAVARREKAAA